MGSLPRYCLGAMLFFLWGTGLLQMQLTWAHGLSLFLVTLLLVLYWVIAPPPRLYLGAEVVVLAAMGSLILGAFPHGLLGWAGLLLPLLWLIPLERPLLLFGYLCVILLPPLLGQLLIGLNLNAAWLETWGLAAWRYPLAAHAGLGTLAAVFITAITLTLFAQRRTAYFMARLTGKHHLLQQLKQVRQERDQEKQRRRKDRQRIEDLEQELAATRQQVKSKEAFFSAISHDLRTPLSSIAGLARLMLYENPREDQRDRLRVMGFATENALQLVGDIMDFARLQEGKLRLEQKAFHLPLLLENLLEVYRPLADEKGVRLRLEQPEKLNRMVQGDPLRLSQVFSNLIGNAIKFTENGEVVVHWDATVEEEHLWLDFAVSDTGIGLTDEQREHLFSRFEQAAPNIEGRYGGSGLGLFITQELLRLMGSEVEVSSTYGEGSRFAFSLRLPLSHQAEASEPPAEPEAKGSLKGLRVLIAEDNPMNAEILTVLLDRWEVNYTVVSNGKAALRLVQQHPFDLVLMDLYMPEMDGLTAASEIRDLEDPQLAQIPITIMTAVSEGMEEELARAGADGILYKPLHPAKLYRCLQRRDQFSMINDQ